jgi:hypothetical protein
VSQNSPLGGRKVREHTPNKKVNGSSKGERERAPAARASDGAAGAAGGVQPVRARVLPQRCHPAAPPAGLLLPSLLHHRAR